MSLNTNGWDYGYHINLNKVNNIINSNTDSVILQNFITALGNSNINTLNNLTDLNSNINTYIKNSITAIKLIELYKDIKQDPRWSKSATSILLFYDDRCNPKDVIKTMLKLDKFCDFDPIIYEFIIQ